MSQQSVIERIVQTTGDIPSIPPVAQLVLDKISNENTSAQELNQVISKDQALMAKVLKLANSPLFGYSRKVSKLSDAILVMGFKNIKSLVMASALQDFFKKFGLAEKLLWEHSLACASISKKIALSAKLAPMAEEAFLAGMLHDIGKVVLNLRTPDKMLGILQEVYANPGLTFSELEEKVYGFSHSEVGQLTARKWHFAPEIEEAIGSHHCPERAKVAQNLCHIVNLANAFCHKLEIGPTKNPDLNLAELKSAKVLKLGQDELDELLEHFSSTVTSQDAVFSI